MCVYVCGCTTYIVRHTSCMYVCAYVYIYYIIHNLNSKYFHITRYTMISLVVFLEMVFIRNILLIYYLLFILHFLLFNNTLI